MKQIRERDFKEYYAAAYCAATVWGEVVTPALDDIMREAAARMGLGSIEKNDLRGFAGFVLDRENMAGVFKEMSDAERYETFRAIFLNATTVNGAPRFEIVAGNE